MIRRSRVGTILASASVATVGASFARDAYKAAKRNIALLVVFIASGAILYLPYKGGRIVTGSGPYFRWRWTLTSALPGLMIAVTGWVVQTLLAIVISDFLPKQDGDPGLWAILIASLMATILFVGGSARGRFVYRARSRADAVVVHNQLFLETNDFEDANDRDASYRDRDGNLLRLISTESNRLVFMAVGRRKQRAYIKLDDEGRMLSYSGIVTI